MKVIPVSLAPIEADHTKQSKTKPGDDATDSPTIETYRVRLPNRNDRQFRQFKGIKGLYQVALDATAVRRYTMLNVYADSCSQCHKMESLLFSDERVQQLLEEVLLVQTDVTSGDDIDRELLNRLGVTAPPAILFFDPTGREIENSRILEYLDADQFVKHIKWVLSDQAS